MREINPMASVYFGRMRWRSDGTLEPAELKDGWSDREPDVLDILVTDFAYGDMLGVPKDSLAVREKLRTSVLYVIDHRRLAP